MAELITKSPTDKRLWRRVLAAVHPDRGGDHDLFCWLSSVREHVVADEGNRPGASTPKPSEGRERARVPYPVEVTPERFDRLTGWILEVAGSHDLGNDKFGDLLFFVHDCATAIGGALERQQREGATYKTLAAIAHRAGLSKEERIAWYRVAESLPLSQRHAGHILGHLQGDGRDH